MGQNKIKNTNKRAFQNAEMNRLKEKPSNLRFIEPKLKKFPDTGTRIMGVLIVCGLPRDQKRSSG